MGCLGGNEWGGARRKKRVKEAERQVLVPSKRIAGDQQSFVLSYFFVSLFILPNIIFLNPFLLSHSILFFMFLLLFPDLSSHFIKKNNYHCIPVCTIPWRLQQQVHV